MSPAHRIAHRGSVLIVVLWASIALVSVALLFGHSMMLNYRGVDNEIAGRQADAAIDGAIRYAQILLTEVESPGMLPELTYYEGEAVPVGESAFWFLGRPEDAGNGTTREYSLLDEAAKVNVNKADTGLLEALPRVTEEIAKAIVNWRTPSTGGVADETQKGAPFESVEELALVPGMTSLILYGEDTNGNGVLDPNEDDGDVSPPADNADGKLDPGLIEYLTVFTRESDKQDNGDDRIDVGQLASDSVTAEVRTMIARVLPDAAPPTFAQRAYGSVLEFLGSLRPALSDEDCDRIVPNLTSGDPQKPGDPQNPGEPLVEGLVNVNTASETVLTALVGQEAAANLVAARALRTLPSTGFTWAVDQLPPAVLQSPVTRYLTGQTFQVSADIAAVGRHGRGYRRTRVVLDTTGVSAGEPPKIIYRRDLAPLGWALGSETREQLALKKEAR